MRVIKDNAQCKLASAYTAGSGSITVDDVSSLPGQYPYCLTAYTITEPHQPLTKLKVTNRTGNVLTLGGTYDGYADANLIINTPLLIAVEAGLFGEFKTALDDLSGSVTVNANALTDLTATVSDQGTSISAIQSTVSANSSTLTTLVGQTTTLSSQVSSQGTSIGTLQSTVSTNSSTLTTLVGQTTTLSSRVDTIESTVTDQGSDLGTLSTTVATLASLPSQVSTLSGNVADLSDTVDGLASLPTDVSSLQSTVSTNSSTLTTLSGTVASQGSTLSSLSGTVSANSSALTSLQSTVSTNSSTLTTLVGTVSTNSSTLTSLQSTVSTKADNSVVVKLTGDQTITGTKKFAAIEVASGLTVRNSVNAVASQFNGTTGYGFVDRMVFCLARGVDLVTGTNLTTAGSIASFKGTVAKVLIQASVNGSSGGFTLDVKKNGTSIFSTAPTVANSTTSVQSFTPSSPDFNAADVFTVDCTAVGSGVQTVNVTVVCLTGNQ